MPSLKVFSVSYAFVKASTSAPGAASQRREHHIATVSATSGHPKDILTVLNADLTIPAGHTLELLSVSPVAGSGTDGDTILS